MDYHKILIAIDDSAYSMKAAKAGFALAHSLKAEIGLIYVIDRSKEAVSADLGITAEQSKAVMLEEAENTIRQFIKMYDEINRITRFTPEGSPEKEIINIAREWKADLIVMGSHGRSGLSRLMTGSTTGYVIRHAEIPVMVTPPEMT
jgi:nucleotide-binding universal stress UspA family protein